MTQEEKAKAYDEALERAKGVIEQNPLMEYLKKGIEYILPELAESEDERIRKDIIVLVKDWWDRVNKDNISTKEQMLTWLEKQCEHKKFRDSIQVGDKVTRNKDGVLVNLSQLNRVAKKQGEQKTTYTKEYDFHGIKFIPKFAKGDIIKDKKRDKVSTIKDFSYDTGLYTHTYGQFPITIQDNYEIIEQKPAWSEEDEKMWSQVINEIEAIKSNSSTVFEKNIAQDKIDFLKALKERYAWNPSDEQMEYLAKAIATLGDEGNCKTASILNDLRVELKKLMEE